MKLLVVEKWSDVLVALTANIANVEIRLVAVFSQVYFELNFVEKSVTAKVANEPSKFLVDVLVVFQMKVERNFIFLILPADQTNVVILVRFEVAFEIIKTFKVEVTQSA